MREQALIDLLRTIKGVERKLKELLDEGRLPGQVPQKGRELDRQIVMK